MANVKNNLAAQETRRRLLQAAGEVFAEKGPHAATTKEITDRAGVNIAAINYHFKDKAELYIEVLRHVEAELAAIVPPANALTGDPEQRFRQCVRHITLTMLGRGQPPWERLLLAREFVWPSPVARSLMDNVGTPLNRILGEIIGELINLAPTTEVVGHLTASTMDQCAYYLQHQSRFQLQYPQFKRAPSPEHIAEHIIKFSLAGISAYADKGSRTRRNIARSRHTD